MPAPRFPERLRAFVAERTGLSYVEIDSVLKACETFYRQTYPEVLDEAATRLIELDESRP